MVYGYYLLLYFNAICEELVIDRVAMFHMLIAWLQHYPKRYRLVAIVILTVNEYTSKTLR